MFPRFSLSFYSRKLKPKNNNNWSSKKKFVELKNKLCSMVIKVCCSNAHMRTSVYVTIIHPFNSLLFLPRLFLTSQIQLFMFYMYLWMYLWSFVISLIMIPKVNHKLFNLILMLLFLFTYLYVFLLLSMFYIRFFFKTNVC